MPGLTSTSYGSGDQRWLRSSHGLHNALSGYGLLANFTASTHYPDGFIPSGTAVDASNEGDLKPYTGADGERLGFILNDIHVPIGNDPGFNTPYLPHGTVDVDHLPNSLPENTAGRGAFVFVGEGA